MPRVRSSALRPNLTEHRRIDVPPYMRHMGAMLRIDDITYAVEGRPLFEGASATIPEGHKVGFVGRNGTGKTTLFRLIQGELALQDGHISLPTRARIGGVAQEAPASEVSLLDTVLAADTERASLLAEAETATDPGRIADIQTRLADIDAWSAEARASSILKGLGFDDDEQRRPCSEFSGGWRDAGCPGGCAFCGTGPAAARRTDQLPRPRGGAVARELHRKVSPHCHHHQPRPGTSEPRGRGHSSPRGQEAVALPRAIRPLSRGNGPRRSRWPKPWPRSRKRAGRTCNPMSTGSATRRTRRNRPSPA